MRLLNAETKQFEEFFDRIPSYAILSHTWGPTELTFEDMKQNRYVGSQKVDGCCEQALKNGLKYVWIDTCCIDKSSSAELSEAINSMWAWYGQSTVCYAYLSDIPPGIDLYEENSLFSRSRWFTRGWTLQELIAPRKVEFYDESWNFIGLKSEHGGDQEFKSLLSRRTKIDVQALTGSLRGCSIAQKMSWAAGRTTTRVEDMAYSLLGLFGINMPLLYGEGKRAFIRLQEEILKASDDESIFAWDFGKFVKENKSLFASSPADFVHCGGMVPSTPAGVKPSHYTLTNKGLHIEISLCDLPIEGGIALARLNCSHVDKIADEKSLALTLVRSRENDMILTRHCDTAPVLVPLTLFTKPRSQVYVHRSEGHRVHNFYAGLGIRGSIVRDTTANRTREFYPPTWRAISWNNSGILLWEQRENLESQRQNILFLVDTMELPNYAIWFDYRFSLDMGAKKMLIPQKLKCLAAFIGKDKTLAEVMIQNKNTLESALDWQEVLDLGDAELRFAPKQERWKGFDRWVVDIDVHKKK